MHDAMEVYAGDTSTLRPLTDWQRAAKAAREHAAVGEWHAEFGEQLPWLPAMIARYERQDTPEARYVRTVDKLLTGLVHFCNDARGLHEYGYTAAEHEAQQPERYAQMTGYAAAYPEILAIRREVSRRLVILLREREAEHEPLRTSGGVVLTEELIEQLADEAEAGYDPARFRPRSYTHFPPESGMDDQAAYDNGIIG